MVYFLQQYIPEPNKNAKVNTAWQFSIVSLPCAQFSELLFSVLWIFWLFSWFLVYAFSKFSWSSLKPLPGSSSLVLVNSHNSSAALAILFTRLCPFCIVCFYSHFCNLIFYRWMGFFLFFLRNNRGLHSATEFLQVGSYFHQVNLNTQVIFPSFPQLHFCVALQSKSLCKSMKKRF